MRGRQLLGTVAVLGVVSGLVFGTLHRRGSETSVEDRYDSPGLVELASRADLIAAFFLEDIEFLGTETLFDDSGTHRYSLNLDSAVESMAVTSVGQRLGGTIVIERDADSFGTLEQDLPSGVSQVIAFITDWSKVGTDRISLYVVGMTDEGELVPVDGRVTDGELDALAAVSGDSMVALLAELGRARNVEKGYELGLPPSGLGADGLAAVWPDRDTASDRVAAWQDRDRFERAIDPEVLGAPMAGRVPVQLLVNVEGDVSDRGDELVYLLDDLGVLHGFALSAKSHSSEIYLDPNLLMLEVARSSDGTYPAHSVAVADHDVAPVVDGHAYGLELVVTARADGSLSIEFGRVFATEEAHAEAFATLLEEQGLIREGTPSG